jgi:hypothetical protein
MIFRHLYLTLPSFRFKAFFAISLLSLIPLLAAAQDLPRFEHPRGLVNTADVPSLRERVKKQPYALILEQIKASVLEQQNEQKTWSSYELSDLALKNAQIFLLTGEAQWAKQARFYVEKTLRDTIYFQNPVGRGLTKADQLLKIMMAYDYCYEVWDLGFKKEFCEITYEAILTLSSNMGRQANYDLASNWMGVRYGTVLYAALIWDDFEKGNIKTSKIRPFIYDATKRVSDFALANVQPGGWNAESMGYQTYGWSFIFPALIAWEKNTQLSSKIFDYYNRMIAGQRAWATAAVAIPRTNSVGIKPDFSDDGVGSSARLVPYIIQLAPDSVKPYFRWLNRLYFSKKKDIQLIDGGFESILYDKLEEPARKPPKAWLKFVDENQGIVVLRNQFKDEQDVVFAFSATSYRRGHQGGDNLSFRLIGLNNIWAVGSGRTRWIGGQTSFFSQIPTDTSKFESILGDLEKVDLGERGNKMVASGSCTGVIDHTRVIKVAFNDVPEKPTATLVIKDDSQNGKIWRLNTPEFNQVKLKKDGFEIIGPNGHKLIAQVKKNSLKNYQLTTGKHRYGGKTVQHNYGIPYYDKEYPNSKYIDIECDGSIVVKMSLWP